MNRQDLTHLVLATLVFVPLTSRGAEQVCIMPEAVGAPPSVLAEREAEDSPARVRADDAQYDRAAGQYRFTGNVELERVDQYLRADRIDYTEPTGLAEAEGDLLYGETGFSLTAREGFMYLDQSRGQFFGTQFGLDPGTAHGDADRADVLDRNRVRLDNVRYTLCPEGEEAWWLRGSELELDRESGIGTARHARVEFMGVPLFYSPYVSFPIDDKRKSGFLAPAFGFSGDNGFDLETPYYLNLAPNYDLTLYPRLITKRGFMLGLEPRLLTEHYETRGYFEYMPHDRRGNDDEDPSVDSTRWLASGEIWDTYSGPFSYRAEFNRVSDGQYFDDFDSGLLNTNTSHLPSYAQAAYRQPNWSLTAQARTWQTLDETIRFVRPQNKPYRHLPRIAFDYDSNPYGAGWATTLDAEVVNFAHPHEDLRTTGLRADLMPQLSYRIIDLGYFVTPSIGLNHTRYDLDRALAESTAADTPTRTVPVFSLDTGVFLERELELFDRQLLQTLEPRLMYLYVPERDQDELPLFDTSRADLTFSRLFNTNRFVGSDRYGDANQFALGLTSRFLNRNNGRQYLRASLGQIYYVDEPDVTLRPAATDEERAQQDRSRSNLLGELQFNIGAVVANLDAEWDPYDHRTERSGIQLSYRPGGARLINVGYRTRRDDYYPQPLEQTEFSFVWPVRNNVFALGGWHYSLREKATLERFAGIAYQDCCWSARLVVREWVDEDELLVENFEDEYERAIMFQLQLNGLGAFGQPVAEFVQEVTGYNIDEF